MSRIPRAAVAGAMVLSFAGAGIALAVPASAAAHCDPAEKRTFQNTANNLDVKYHTFVQNKTSKAIKFEFSSLKSGTTTYGLSISVSNEFKLWIFAKAKVEINGSITKSWTSSIGVKAYGDVKAKSTIYGDYGITRENFTVKDVKLDSLCRTTTTYVKAHAPYREGWSIHY